MRYHDKRPGEDDFEIERMVQFKSLRRYVGPGNPYAGAGLSNSTGSDSRPKKRNRSEANGEADGGGAGADAPPSAGEEGAPDVLGTGGIGNGGDGGVGEENEEEDIIGDSEGMGRIADMAASVRSSRYRESLCAWREFTQHMAFVGTVISFHYVSRSCWMPNGPTRPVCLRMEYRPTLGTRYLSLSPPHLVFGQWIASALAAVKW